MKSNDAKKTVMRLSCFKERCINHIALATNAPGACTSENVNLANLY